MLFTVFCCVWLSQTMVSGIVLVKQIPETYSGGRAIEVSTVILEGTVQQDGKEVAWSGPLADSGSEDRMKITNRLCGKLTAQLVQVHGLENKFLLCVVQPIEGKEKEARTVIYLKKTSSLNPEFIKSTVLGGPSLAVMGVNYDPTVSVFVQNGTVFLGNLQDLFPSHHDHDEHHDHHHTTAAPQHHHKISELLREPSGHSHEHEPVIEHGQSPHGHGSDLHEDLTLEEEHFHPPTPKTNVWNDCTYNNTNAKCVEIRSVNCENGICDHHENEVEDLSLEHH
ncbi:unnamed protein product [Dicrocoelium dendriticum]|nr:unnamed protein product [Dicrocoelium dendriticum]